MTRRETHIPKPEKVITREQALRQGLPRFFTGKPCRKAGHVSWRRTSDWGCYECNLESSRNSHRRAARKSGTQAEAQTDRTREPERERTHLRCVAEWAYENCLPFAGQDDIGLVNRERLKRGLPQFVVGC